MHQPKFLEALIASGKYDLIIYGHTHQARYPRRFPAGDKPGGMLRLDYRQFHRGYCGSRDHEGRYPHPLGSRRRSPQGKLESTGGYRMEKVINKTKLILLQDDITRQETDAIVNAANSSLMGGGGVDGAIHRAGGRAILEDCKKIVAERGRLPAGQAVITTGGNLKARHVIHTVGPVWHGGQR